MSVDIRGKWALVTGAARGVGRQIALGLAQRGCNLVLHSRERAHTPELEQEDGEAHGALFAAQDHAGKMLP